MDKTKDTGMWLKFFKDAGIPTKTGASYAHIFNENRIHKDMLSDLSVDHLRLMGITLIGDIIAILRHAKSVHQDSLRKVVILKSKDDPPESSSSSSSSSKSNSSSSNSSSSSSSSEEDVEMVEVKKPVRKLNTSLGSKVSVTKVKKESTPHTEESRKLVRSKVINNTPPASLSKLNTGSDRNQSLKRKLVENKKSEDEELSFKKIALKTTNSSNSGRSILRASDTQVKTVRATAENEFFGPKLPPPKKTVFDRLGAETSSPQVSSTTEVFRPEVETKFTRTIGSVNMPTADPVKIVANIDIPPPKSSSVFNRLGGVGSEPPPGPTLQYAGVLKSPPAVNRPLQNVTKKIVTMRADEPEVPIKLRATAKTLVDKHYSIRVGETSFKAKQKPKLTRARLGNVDFRNPASEGIFANPKNTLHLSAKARLGLQSQQNSLNKGVKARLSLQSNSSKTLSSRPVAQRIRRPMEGQQQFGNKHISESTGGSKKVSFGGVEQRFVSPMRGGRNGVGAGIHSRLGTRRLI